MTSAPRQLADEIALIELHEDPLNAGEIAGNFLELATAGHFAEFAGPPGCRRIVTARLDVGAVRVPPARA